jgi:aspartyl-tRNA(Asn)/glutamyl-tRNA(Gln) amidotransferase subunit A
MDMPNIAIAESTGGSISCPASFCGVVGLTPTYGLVSRWGLIDYACSLDKIGCIGKTVYDVALLLSIIACHDERDSTSLNVNQKDYTKKLDEKTKKIKAAIPKEYLENIDTKVEKTFWDAVTKLEKEGFEYKEVRLPHTKYALASYYIIACSEASTNLAKFCGIRYGLELEFNEDNFDKYFSRVRSEGFGEEVKRRIILGTFARMMGYRDKYYLKAMQVRTLVINDFKKVLKNFDCILSPTMPILPPRFNDIEKLSPLEVYQCDVLTTPVNLAGLPHLSLPCGFATDRGSKLPVGMHVICDHLQEERMLIIANSIEKILSG